MKYQANQVLKRFSMSIKDARVWGFFLALAVLIVYGGLTSPRSFQYDPGYYWALRRTFLDPQGNFHLFNYSDWLYHLRGYLFPLLLLSAEWVLDTITPDRFVDDYLIVVLFNAAQIAIAGWFFIPSILSFLTGRDFPVYLRAGWVLILALFWHGLLYQPFSDLPAFFLFLAAVLFYLGTIRFSGWRSLTLAFLAGAMAAAAYLIRPVYLSAWLVLFLGVFVFSGNWRSLFQKIAHAALFLLAGILLLAPQAMINKIHYNLSSPFTSAGLYEYQITVGFILQRLDVNQDRGIYPYSAVRFVDAQGVTILEREKRDLSEMVLAGDTVAADAIMGKLFSSGEFINLWLKYPLDMLTIYFRHFFNGLNLMYPSIAVWDIYRVDALSMWLNYTVLFGVLFFFDIRPLFTKSVPISLSVLLAWLLPVLVAIPGTVEARYFLPLHVLLETCFVWMLGDIASLKQKIERFGRGRTLLLYVIFVLLAFSISGLILTTALNADLLLTPR